MRQAGQDSADNAFGLPVAAANDTATARRLWELSEELTGVRHGLAAA